MIAPRARLASIMILLMATAGSAWSDEITIAPTFAALASDRIAHQAGDTLTVLVIETSTASRASATKTGRKSSIFAEGADGTGRRAEGEASLGSSFQGSGQNGRSGNLVAQISVIVQGVRPNGELDVTGEQILRIDGERTRIRLVGRVRPADISTDNTVMSNRLSGVSIDYDGGGFATRGARPGIASRILNWLGLF